MINSGGIGAQASLRPMPLVVFHNVLPVAATSLETEDQSQATTAYAAACLCLFPD